MYIDNLETIKDFLVGKYSVREGRAFFADPPLDTEIQPEERRWTKWKKTNLVYFKRELENEDSSKIIFDVGVGGAPFREIFSRFKKVIGIDFYPYRHAIIIADLTKPLPFKNACCDIIFMSNVLEHIPNPEKLLLECYRLLTKGGYIIATVPFLVSVHRPPYDFYRYTNFMLERLLRQTGFEEIEVKSLGSPFHVYETIQRQFFSILPKTFWTRLWKRMAWFMFARFKNTVSQEPHAGYTQGYGFFAKKL